MDEFYREVLYVVSRANVDIRDEYLMRCSASQQEDAEDGEG